MVYNGIWDSCLSKGQTLWRDFFTSVICSGIFAVIFDICLGKMLCNQEMIQSSADQHSNRTADHTPQKDISKRFKSSHPHNLTFIHSHSPHHSVLSHSRRHAHGILLTIFSTATNAIIDKKP